MNKIKPVLLIFIVFIGIVAKAQDTSVVKNLKPKMYVIETFDGASVTGSAVSEDDKQVVLQTKSMGLITVLKSKIKTIKEIDESSFVQGEYWFENPNATRYVIGPSAFSLKEGEGYYQNLYLFGQSINVGVTDHISIGGGTEIVSVIFGQEPPSVFFLTPKIGFDIAPKFKLGTGVLYINVRGFGRNNDKSHFGIIYGLATTGTLNNNFTLGLGWSYHNYKTYPYYNNQPNVEKGFSEMPIITLSGMTRPAKRFALTTENWIFPVKSSSYNYSTNTSTTSYTYQYFLSYGMRFIGERISVDFGFINNGDIFEAIFIGIPYIDFVVKFGGKNR